MRQVIILQGISGSGKTTYASKLRDAAKAKGLSARVVSADHFFESDHEYRFDPTKLSEAHGSCFRRFLASVNPKSGDDQNTMDLIIVDNTNTGAVEIAPYVLAAEAYGWEVEIHRINCDPEVAAARNVHRVPRATVQKQAHRLAGQVYPSRWKVIEADR